MNAEIVKKTDLARTRWNFTGGFYRICGLMAIFSLFRVESRPECSERLPGGPRAAEKLRATQTLGDGKQWIDRRDLDKFIETKKYSNTEAVVA